MTWVTARLSTEAGEMLHAGEAREMVHQIKATVWAGGDRGKPTRIVMHPELECAALRDGALGDSGMDEFAQVRSIWGVPVTTYDPYPERAHLDKGGRVIVAQVQWTCGEMVLRIENVCLDVIEAVSEEGEGA